VCSKSKTGKNYCLLCNAEVAGRAIFCSAECEERHYDYILIDVPRRWVSNTLERLKCPERYYAIVAYSKRHSYDLQLLRKKLKEKYKLDICRGY